MSEVWDNDNMNMSIFIFSRWDSCMTFVLTAQAGRRGWRLTGFVGLICHHCLAVPGRAHIYFFTFLVNYIGMVQTEELGHDE
jgi:hypothetical protein